MLADRKGWPLPGFAESLQRDQPPINPVLGSVFAREQTRSPPPGLVSFDPLAPTIFHQPWWLEIATRGRYRVAEVRQNGRIVGRMPYADARRLGCRISRMPPLTHFLGPAVEEGCGSANTRFLHRMDITRDLINSLPRFANFRQTFHRGIPDTLSFQLEGFASAVQFTYEISPRPEQDIWLSLRDKTRNMVRKARRSLICETSDDPDLFLRFYADNLTAHNRTSRLDMGVCRDLIAGCLARRCGRIYLARGADRSISAAIFCAWDAVSAYYLMSTRAPGSGNSANTLLVWDAIRDLTAQGLIFDFDGVGQSGHVLFYIGFSSVLQPRYVASYSGRFTQVVSSMRHAISNARSPFY